MTPVVLVFPTIQDGPTVRWYWSTDAARYGGEMASATRVRAVSDGAPFEIMLAAYAAHEVLRADRDADMTYLATHRRVSGPGLADELVELERPAVPVAETEQLPSYVRRLMHTIDVVTAQRDRAVADAERTAEIARARHQQSRRLHGEVVVALAQRAAALDALAEYAPPAVVRRASGMPAAATELKSAELRPFPWGELGPENGLPAETTGGGPRG